MKLYCLRSQYLSFRGLKTRWSTHLEMSTFVGVIIRNSQGLVELSAPLRAEVNSKSFMKLSVVIRLLVESSS